MTKAELVLENSKLRESIQECYRQWRYLARDIDGQNYGKARARCRTAIAVLDELLNGVEYE